MNRVLLFAVLASLLAFPAAAQEITGRGQFGFQQYDFGQQTTSGFRQTYDLRWQSALTLTSFVRLYLRGDDFRGSVIDGGLDESSHTRQLQPIGEFFWNTERLRAQARSEWLKLDSSRGPFGFGSTVKRNFGKFEWAPGELPVLMLRAQHDDTTSAGAQVGQTFDNVAAGLRYEWRGLQAKVEERYDRTADPFAGYNRKTTTHEGELDYSLTAFDSRLAVAATGNAQLAKLDETSTDGKSTSVPVPVAVSRGLYAVDDTPNDGRDHPLAPNPLLVDGDVNASAGIALGPDAVSFQNLALDLGRTDRADELRVYARDAAGNPLRTGGGSVSWDFYTSEDGVLWTPHPSQTAWVPALSYYSVTFDLTTARWFKVVNFGVNVEATFVTELQAYYHRALAAGSARNGTQNHYTGTATITAQATKKLLFTYSGTYTSIQEKLNAPLAGTSRSLEHVLGAEYRPITAFAIRTQLLRRDASSLGVDGSGSGATLFFDWTPTRQLRVVLENGRETEMLSGLEYTVDSVVLHGTATVIRSVVVNVSGGVQSQTIAGEPGSAKRRFFDGAATMYLTRTLRFDLTATLQRADELDAALQLLGPERDTRYAGELTWRPGRPLVLRARFGKVSGVTASGMTQQYHAEWYPFADGTVSLGGTYDSDIDPLLGRRATRLVFTPRWSMNPHAAIDVNYTAVSNGGGTPGDRQRTFFATITLTK